MKKIWKIVKSVVETFNNIYMLFAAFVTAAGIWAYVLDERKNNSEKNNVVDGVFVDSEEELFEDDFEQFVFKRREKSR